MDQMEIISKKFKTSPRILMLLKLKKAMKKKINQLHGVDLSVNQLKVLIRQMSIS